MDDAPRMPARGHELLKSVGAETAAQVEGAARDGKAGREGEEDAEALRDAAHVHSGEADEDAQKPRDEQHEVPPAMAASRKWRITVLPAPIWNAAC